MKRLTGSKLTLLFIGILAAFCTRAQVVANFSANKLTGCVPLQVNFTNLSTGSPTNYLWDFGNSNTSTLINPSATYVVAGKYTVSLTVSNGVGSNTKTITEYITVYPLPKVDFDAVKRIGCAPLSVQFRDSSNSGPSAITQWSWDFGNGNISTQRHPLNVYTLTGSYKVSLQATDVNGCSNIQIKNNYVQTVNAPTVDFSASSTFACSTPFSPNFTSSVSPAGAYTYLWNFGSLGTGTNPNQSFTFNQEGFYNVALRVSTPQCTVSVTKPSFIKIRKITPDFVIAGTPDLCEPGKLVINNTSDFDTLGIVYDWKLNGVSVSNFKNLNLTNLAAGAYAVSLTLSIGTCQAVTVKNAFFTVLPGSRSNFDAVRRKYCKVPETVQFRDSSTNAVSWFWNFGNGQTSTQRNPTHTFNQFGNYTITLITSHSNGCRDTLVKEDYIQLISPIIKPNGLPEKGCIPLKVDFSVADTNNIGLGNFQWTLANGAVPATGANPSHTYTTAGTYLVEVTATNSEGCIAKGTDTILAGTPITIDFSSPKKLYCRSELPVTMTVITNPSVPASSYKWVITDSLTNQNGTVLNFRDTGWKRMTLSVDYLGCTTTLIKDSVLRVVGPEANFEVQFNGCSKAVVTFKNNSLQSYNKFIWDFGNGKKDSAQFNPTHVYDSAGTYLVKLTMIDTIHGCTSTMNRSVIVPIDFIPSFRIEPKVGCAPFTATLTNTSVPFSEVASCQFVIGPQILTGNIVKPLIASPGKYTVTMMITDKKGCTHTLTKIDSIQAYGASVIPIISPTFGCAPILVTVKDSSKMDGFLTRRVWYWGNGDSTVYTNADSIFSRNFYAKGPTIQNDGYTIRLVVEDNMGCRHFANRKIFLSKPIPSFTTTQFKTCLRDTFTFTPLADASIGLTPLSFQWQVFGTTQNTRIGKVVIMGDTSLPVQLKVTDVYGCTDSIVVPVKVITGPPVPDFDATPKVINCPGPPVFFSDFSKPGSSPITKWRWEFGDGGISDLTQPNRIYLLPGSYSVKLQLTDSLGCVAEKTIPDLVLIGGPKVVYSISPKEGCAPLQVQFSASGLNVAKYEWDLADGTKDTLPNLKYTYTRAGIYVPNLSLEDSSGCKVGMPPIDTLLVYANPQVNFSVSKRVNCLGNDVKVFSLVTPDTAIAQFNWWIDGTALFGKGPLDYSCNRVGNIPVLLEAIDNKGCKGFKADSFAILVFKDSIAPPAPTAYRATVNSDEIVQFDLKSTDVPDLDHYEVGYNFVGGLATQTRVISNPMDTFQLFQNLNTLQYTYSYQLRAVDACRNISKPSETHTTIELKATGKVNAVELKWNPYQGWDSVWRYSVYRFNEQTRNFDKIASTNGSTLTYLDTQVFCHKLFRYKVRGEKANLFSWSDSAAAVPLFEPTTPQTRAVRATVIQNKEVLVQWWKRKHRYSFQYELTRISDDPFEPKKVILLSSRDSFYVDKLVDVQRYAYAYTIRLKDECGGFGEPSNIAQNIVLKLEVEKNDKLSEDPVLRWQPYKEWASGVERYELFFRNDSLGIDELIATRYPKDTLQAIHNYLSFDQDDYCYYVKAYQQDSNWVESTSNLTCMSTEPRLYAPNAFTVNGDNINDGFLIKGVFVKQFELHIYDRWGNLVFYTTDMNQAWNGTFEGQAAKNDVYVFLAKAWGRKEKFASVKGNVTLLR